MTHVAGPQTQQQARSIPESLIGLVPESGPVKYSEWINALRQARKNTLRAAPDRDQWWQWIRDKKAGKHFALSLGIPVARAFDLDEFVVKPRVGDSGAGLRFFSSHVCEERLRDETHEFLVAYKLYMFAGVPKLICATNSSFGKQYGYYLPDWTPVQPRREPAPWLEVGPPSCLPLMFETAERVAREFPIPIRMDCYATDRGMYWGELAATSGLRDKLTDEWNDLMGQWFTADMVARYGPSFRSE